MLIQRSQEILGMPAVTMRGIVSELYRTAYTTRALQELAPGGVSGEDLHKRLRADGYIEPADPGMPYRLHDDEQNSDAPPVIWTTTVKGSALAKARIGRPMPREKGERLVDELLSRVRAVNESPDGVYWIEWVDLFGSITDPDRHELGDVDVHVLAVGRFEGREQQLKERELADRASRDGRRFHDMFERLAYPQKALERVLRNRSKLIDLQLDIHSPDRIPSGSTAIRVYERPSAAGEETHL